MVSLKFDMNPKVSLCHCERSEAISFLIKIWGLKIVC